MISSGTEVTPERCCSETAALSRVATSAGTRPSICTLFRTSHRAVEIEFNGRSS
jgi:hypothetical protein